MIKEQGKFLKEVLGEVEYGVGFIKWFSEEVKCSYGDIIFVIDSKYCLIMIKQLIGVVVGIIFWNFLIVMIICKVVFVYVVGCSFVIKFLEYMLLCVIVLVYFVDKVGFVKGVLNVVVFENVKMVGEIMIELECVCKFIFIGLIGVGK